MQKRIRISDIIIKPNRQRKELDPKTVTEIRESIEAIGLLNPPVLRSEEGKLVLVAGETRLKAMADIFELDGYFTYDQEEFREGWVPYSELGDLTELGAEEAELDENIKRKDLSWQERADAHSRLHRLRQKQKPKTLTLSSESAPDDPRLNGTVVVGTEHTVADTAKEIFGRSDGSYQDTIRKELIVSKHLGNPAVAKAKTMDEAFKILKKEEQRAQNIELAKTVGATFNADKHQLLNVNCLDYMREVADGRAHEYFDVILTDPPYGMDADSFGDGGGKFSGIEHHYDDSYESWQKLMQEWCHYSIRITKPQAHAYVFCDIDNFHELKSMMQGVGWYVFRTPLVIHKINSGRVPLPDQGPRRQYELVLYAIKGKKPVTHIYPDVISAQADANTSHGAQKPVAVYQNLLQRSVRPGDRVFDGFAGSGTIFEAAHGYKCTAVGCELNPEYFAISLKRIKQLKELETPSLFEGM